MRSIRGTLIAGTILLVLVIGAVENPALVAAQEVHQVTTVLLVRHAEKADDTGDPPLSTAGEARAKRLVQVAGWSGVKAIYTSEALRAKLTAQPLADCLVLKPIIYADVKSLVRELVSKHAGQVVLVVSHTDWIQQVIDALAGTGSSAPTDSGYDSFHVLTIYAPGKASLLRLKYGETVKPAPCIAPK